MKKIIFTVFSMLIAMPLLALEIPNWVSCRSQDGRDTLKLVYTTTSYHGTPTFTYSRLTDGPLSRKVEGYGESIGITDTVLGEIISVVDSKLSVPDHTNITKWVSLVLPHINLIPKDPNDPDAEDPEVEFETVVVETTAKTSFVGLQIVPGAVQSSQYFDVTCKARIAVFAKPGK